MHPVLGLSPAVREAGMTGSSEPASEGDPPEPVRRRAPVVVRVWACARPALCLAIEVAEAEQHKGPAWTLRGLVWITDLVVVCLGGRHH